MDRKMMNAWLAGQAQKAQITSADIQRKRLGITEQTGKYTTINPGPKPPSLLQRPLPQYDPEFSEDGVPRMLDADRIPRIRNMQPGEYEEGKGPLSPELLDYNRPSLEKKQPKPRTRGGMISEAAKNKKSGVVPQAEARNKAGECATSASTPITEQLNAEEEAYAKEHKSMLKNMVDQYGQEKGTRVFYATVRNKVRGK